MRGTDYLLYHHPMQPQVEVVVKEAKKYFKLLNCDYYYIATEDLTTLYILNKCSVLIGGKCGATIVASYRKNPPYEYVNIIDTHKSY